MLEPDTFDRIPKDVSYSIERGYFPSLVERQEPFFAYIDRGYWIDIGTPEKYVQVHRDMFDGKFAGGSFATVDRTQPIVAPDARVEEGAQLEAPCFVDSGAQIKTGAVIGPYAVIGRGVVVEEEARVTNSIIWPNYSHRRACRGRERDPRPQLSRWAQLRRAPRCGAGRQDGPHRLYKDL